MRRAFLTVCGVLGLLTSACLDEEPDILSVSCANGMAAQTDGISINCDSDVSEPEAPPVILKAGCFVDAKICPQAYEGSWLLEHCTIAYACPAAHAPNPDELICLRFIMDDCWAKY